DPLGGGIDRLELGRGLLDPAGNEAPGQPVERALAGLGMLADDPMLLTWRAVVARRRLEQRLDQGRDLETENLGIALLGDAAAHGGDVESRGWVFKGTGRPYRAVPSRAVPRLAGSTHASGRRVTKKR